ncbi:hypothetical protein Pst134EA_032469 [Puccinia striiformis f. sp. tritici]|uniref:uncharacterized protein n=1 Tax=Puccinia striiformis f. sp. tritici TaxID=168172 RepID=UPI00200852A7|nr:uncharacterized protein Pst134EA_032469 [Puccinia striiformis f. sp. tritici]KAH9440698.1 hypothetical protein Pst134EA_032469 [Puccinia striiformis f. sp. tritici]
MDAAAATNTPTTNPDGSRMTQTDQIVYISNQLCQFGLSPKEFITGFLTRDHPQLIYRQRTWGTDHGGAIHNSFGGYHSQSVPRQSWLSASYVANIHQAAITQGDLSKAHTLLPPAFFSHGALDDRRKRLTLHDTPFLFNLVVGALARPANDQLANNELSAEPANPAAEVSSDGLTPEESEELE